MDLINLIGSVAAVCSTASFLPQAVRTIKTKNTEGISLEMYSILILGVGLWLTYGILIKSLPIILANAITLILTSTIFVLKLKYK